jgi:hypothetical protein
VSEIQKPSYSLSLKGRGISIARNVDQATARAIVDIVLGGAPAAKLPIQIGKAPDTVPVSDGLSVREFLDQSEPTSNPERIAAIGEYVAAYEGQGGFTKDQVSARFRSAGEPAPRNLRRDFARTISRGWIAEDTRNPGTYYVTRKGKTAIADKFRGKSQGRDTHRRAITRDE